MLPAEGHGGRHVDVAVPLLLRDIGVVLLLADRLVAEGRPLHAGLAGAGRSSRRPSASSTSVTRCGPSTSPGALRLAAGVLLERLLLHRRLRLLDRVRLVDVRSRVVAVALGVPGAGVAEDRHRRGDVQVAVPLRLRDIGVVALLVDALVAEGRLLRGRPGSGRRSSELRRTASASSDCDWVAVVRLGDSRVGVVAVPLLVRGLGVAEERDRRGDVDVAVAPATASTSASFFCSPTVWSPKHTDCCPAWLWPSQQPRQSDSFCVRRLRLRRPSSTGRCSPSRSLPLPWAFQVAGVTEDRNRRGDVEVAVPLRLRDIGVVVLLADRLVAERDELGSGPARKGQAGRRGARAHEGEHDADRDGTEVPFHGFLSFERYVGQRRWSHSRTRRIRVGALSRPLERRNRDRQRPGGQSESEPSTQPGAARRSARRVPRRRWRRRHRRQRRLPSREPAVCQARRVAAVRARSPGALGRDFGGARRCPASS